MGDDRWEARYRASDTPWDSGVPSAELIRVLDPQRGARDLGLPSGDARAVELGCGTGTNAVWLAAQGMTVTACDLAPTALARARDRAHAAGVAARVTFIEADLLATPPPDLGGPADLVFDRGVYHVLRQIDLAAYLRVLQSVTRPGTRFVVLTGSCDDRGEGPGPPRIRAGDLCAELEPLFEVLSVERSESAPIRTPDGGVGRRPLGWTAVLARR